MNTTIRSLSFTLLILSLSFILQAQNKRSSKSLITIDAKSLISRSDIYYRSPSKSSEEGLAIGNGEMGTLVWTDPQSPSTIMYQINRNNTFGMDHSHVHYDYNTIPGPNVETTDNCLSLCRMAIKLGQANFKQQKLSPFEGRINLNYTTATGTLNVVTFVSANRDLLIANINDKRKVLEDIVLELSMVRKPYEKNGVNVRQYSIQEQGDKIVIHQKVEEGTYSMQYAVALGVSGRSFHVSDSTPERIAITIEKGDKPFTVMLSTAAVLYKDIDVVSQSINLLAEAKTQGFQNIETRHLAWWNNFWKSSGTFIHLTSKDGVADYLEAYYNLHFYHMASSSRGSFPPLYNYGLWFNDPTGVRPWGAQYKFWNDLMMYYPLYAANYIESAEPYMRMFWNMLPNAKKAAWQRWGVKSGAHIPETVGFSGPVVVPDSVVPILQEYFKGERSRASLPESLLSPLMAEASLDWINPKFPHVSLDHFSWISHIFSSHGALAMLYWWKYQYTGNEVWLREKAYPMMKSVVEFYREYARKGSDGFYHIYPTNVHETYWGVKDGIVDLAVVKNLGPKIIEISRKMNIDEGLRSTWQEFVDHIAPYPVGDHPDVARLQSPSGKGRGESVGLFPPGTFGAGYALMTEGRNNVDPVWMLPMYPHEDITIAKAHYVGNRQDSVNFETMLKTYKYVPTTWFGVQFPSYPPRLGLADEVEKTFPVYVAKTQTSSNGLQGSWGQANFGLLAEGIQSALVQSVDSVIILTPAWPSTWSADFRLLARGGFFVSSSVSNGTPQMVEVESTFGKQCTMANPWGNTTVELIRKGHVRIKLEGRLLKWEMNENERVILVPENTQTKGLAVHIVPRSGKFVKQINVILPDSVKTICRIGKE